MVQYGMVQYGMMWYNMVWYSIAWHGYNMVQYRMVMVRWGMIWYDINDGPGKDGIHQRSSQEAYRNSGGDTDIHTSGERVC